MESSFMVKANVATLGIAANYLFPMQVLLNYYNDTKQYDKADKLYEKLYFYAKQIGKEKLVKNRQMQSIPVH